MTQIPKPPNEGQLYYDNVRDHLVEGAPLIISAERARRPIHILDLVQQSASAGRALPTLYS